MSRLKKSKEVIIPDSETMRVYKVLSEKKKKGKFQPADCFGVCTFKLKKNKWNYFKSLFRLNFQSGFQFFKEVEDAIRFASENDFIFEIEINTKDIKRKGHLYPDIFNFVIYEVKQFILTPEMWESRKPVSPLVKEGNDYIRYAYINNKEKTENIPIGQDVE